MFDAFRSVDLRGPLVHWSLQIAAFFVNKLRQFVATFGTTLDYDLLSIENFFDVNVLQINSGFSVRRGGQANSQDLSRSESQRSKLNYLWLKLDEDRQT